MIALLLLAAAAPDLSAIDAERAFAADAQKLGQWTAFRKYAAPEAMMFTPQPTKAHDFLKGRTDPPVSVFWWPGRSFVSCDGSVAVNTGPWVRGYGKSVGYFTTVWTRQADDGWRWVYDNGDTLKAARAEGGDIAPQKAACAGAAPPSVVYPAMPAHVRSGSGASKDGTLHWFWSVGDKGAHRFRASLWDGHAHKIVIDDRVGP